MTDLADFLRARYNEARQREHAKLKIIPSAFDDHNVEWRYEMDEPEALYVDGHTYPVEKYTEIATAPAPDPDVIADLDAKLALLDEHAQDSLPNGIDLDECRVCGGSNEAWPCPTLRILARPFAGHLDYKEDWAA